VVGVSPCPPLIKRRKESSPSAVSLGIVVLCCCGLPDADQEELRGGRGLRGLGSPGSM